MGRSQQSFSKREREKKKEQKRKEKAERKASRKDSDGPSSFDDMIAYVDEYGNIVDTPPEKKPDVEIDPESIQISVPKDSEMGIDPSKRGRVDFFNDEKGFGFIIEKGNGHKHFVHINEVEGGVLKEGEQVSFELDKGPKGMMAVRVKKV